MKPIGKSLFTILVLLTLTLTSTSRAAEFRGLGSNTVANAVSANGRVIVGSVVVTNTSPLGERMLTTTFRWSCGNLEPIIVPPYYFDIPTASYGAAVSGDGSIIVGSGSANTPAYTAASSFRWTFDDNLIVYTGFKRRPLALSDDGTVEGALDYAFTSSHSEAQLCTPSGCTNLGPASYGNGKTSGVSADGTVAVGWMNHWPSEEAFRWTQASGITNLGFLPGHSGSSAEGVSGNGTVVVGVSWGNGISEAFRWTEADGMSSLGDLTGGTTNSVALAANFNGSIIVGNGNSDVGQEAFIWDATNGMRSLKTVLESNGVNLSGWTLTSATDISADGTVIVGNGTNASGQVEAWMATWSDTYFDSCTETPTGLNASSYSTSQINVSWNGSTNATGYKLQRKISTNGVWGTIALLPQNGTNYLDSGLNIGITYLYRVSATNSIDYSLYSSPVSGMTVAPLPGQFFGRALFSSSAYSVAENAGNASITVYRVNGTAGGVSVQYAINSGTATTLYFAEGETNKTISIPVINNTVVEANKTLNLSLFNPIGLRLSSPSNAVLTIVEDDSAVGISGSATPDFLTENSTNAVITVVRSGNTSGPATVDYATGGQTATGNADYAETQGTLTFASGQTSKAINIPLLIDGITEPSETFRITLSNPIGTTLIDYSNFVLTILDNDGRETLLWHHTDGRMTFWYMDETNFLSGQALANGPAAASGWQLKGVADFNYDGETDFLWNNTISGALAVWFINGTNRLGSTVLNGGRPIAAWRVACLADFDDDGQSDIIWQNSSGQIAVWYMDGISLVSSALLCNGQAAGATWRVVGVHDFNASLGKDILFQNTDGRLAIWFMDGNNRIGASMIRNGQSAGGWKVVGLRDFNNDGQQDILFQDGNGKLAVWFMFGADWFGAGLLSNGKAAGPGWRLVGVYPLPVY